MNILYLHGLDGSLSPEKRKILETYGEVAAPAIDYRANPNCVATVLEMYRDQKIQTIIGSSMGGFLGFHISNKLNLPALLFNPALGYRTVNQYFDFFENGSPNLKHLVVGADDDVVPPTSTLDFIAKQLKTTTIFRVYIRQGLAHRIPLDVFEEEIQIFMNEHFKL